MAELCSDLAEHLEAAASVAPAGWAGAAVLEATADPEPLEPKIVERSVTTFEAQAVPSGTVSNVAVRSLAPLIAAVALRAPEAVSKAVAFAARAFSAALAKMEMEPEE